MKTARQSSIRPPAALRRLQGQFQAQVLLGAQGFETQLVSTTDASAALRQQVYEDAYRLRLAEVIGSDFPGLAALLGEADFETLCNAYIRRYPSPHYNVRWYAEHLAGFLREVPPYAERPALAEMAELEWALTLVFDAGDTALASVADMAALAPTQWARVKVRLQPAWRLLVQHWNVSSLRRAIDRSEAAPALAPLAEPQSLAVWRKSLTVYYRVLEQDEAAALEVARQGGTFADICAALCTWHAEDAVALRAAGLLKTWLEDEWIQRISLAR